jgi:hypothetical protein
MKRKIIDYEVRFSRWVLKHMKACLFVCILGSLVVYSGIISWRSFGMFGFSPSHPLSKKYDYVRIPIEAIWNAYRSTDYWTDKMQARINEKLKWERDWTEFGGIPSANHDLSLQGLSRAITDYTQLAASKTLESSHHSHVPPEGPTLVILNYYESPLNNENAAFFFRHHNPE